MNFYKNTFLFLSSSILRLFFGIILIPIYSRKVTPGDLGTFDFLMTVALFLIAFGGSGYNASILKFGNEEHGDDKLSYILRRITVNAAVVTMLSLPLFWTLNQYLHHVHFGILLLFSLCIAAQVAAVFPLSILKLRDRVAQFSLILAGSSLLKSGVVLLCVFVLDDKILALVLSLAMAKLFTLVFSLIASGTTSTAVHPCRLGREERATIRKYTVPLTMNSIYSWGFSMSDRILVTALRDTVQTGFYGFAQRFNNIFLMVVDALVNSWQLKYFKDGLGEQYDRHSTILISLAAGIGVAIVPLTQILGRFFSVLFDPQYFETIQTLPWLLFSSLWYLLRKIVEMRLLLDAKTKVLSFFFWCRYSQTFY